MNANLLPRLLALALLLGACGTTSSTPTPTPTPPPATTEVVVRDETKVLDEATRGALEEVRADGTLVFTAASGPAAVVSGQAVRPDTFKVGDVIASVPTAAAPFGLLRKVTSVQNAPAGKITLLTSQAKIGDAIKKGKLTASRPLTSADLQSVTPLLEGAQVRVGPAAAGLDYTVNVVLHDQDGDKVNTKDDQIRATGTIHLEPVFDFDLDLDCGTLCLYDNDLDFLFKLGLQERASLKIVAKVSYGASLKVPIFKLNFQPIVFFIGPVPVVITPRLTLEVGLDGTIAANVEFESVQTLTAVAGAKYDDHWSNLSDVTNSFSTSLASAAISLKATARAPLNAEFLFYGVVGPTMGVTAKLELEAVVPGSPVWKLSGGIEGQVGIKVDVLGYTREYSSQLFNLSRQIAQAGNTTPSIAFLSGTEAQIGLGSLLRVQVRDPEDGPACCAVTFRSSNTADGAGGALGTAPGGPGGQPEVSVNWVSLGARTITATVVDSQGGSATASQTITVLNTRPTVTISAPFALAQFFRGVSTTLRGVSYDPNEPGFQLACAGLRWTSSVAGDALPKTGCDVALTFSSNGPRTLTLTGTDTQGATASATVSVTVVDPPANLPPVVNLTSPKNGLDIGPDTVLTLAGTATDPEGGTVTLAWDATPNYNPATGQGGTPVPFTPAANGSWKPSDTIRYNVPGNCGVNDTLRLRLKARDPQGNEGTDFIVLTVTRIC